MDRTHTDIMRGFAIIIILVSHLGGKIGTRIFTPLGGIGVSIFLIASGYGLSKSFQTKGLKGFWKSKIINVFIPYYIVSLISYIYYSDYNYKDVILDFFLIKPLHPYGWYMNYLLLMYIIFYLIQSLKISQKLRNYIYIALSLILIFIMPEIKAEQSFSFIIGILYAFNSEQVWQKLKGKKTTAFCISFILISIAALALKQLDIVRNSYQLVMNIVQLNIKLFGAMGAIILVYLFRNFIGYFNFLALSKISYETYLVHAYTIIMLNKINFLNVLLFFIMTLILSLALRETDKLIIRTLNAILNINISHGNKR